MRTFLVTILLFSCFLVVPELAAQTRVYTPSSVLSTGIWYHITTHEEGVYRIEGNMLSKMGISLPFPSSQLRLFGNGGKMLPESNGASRPDDLLENAIWVEDGGDGLFHIQDQVFFYAPGPHTRYWDSTESRFKSHKNIYTDSARYFITIGGQGKRVKTALPVAATIVVNEADAFYVYENDLTNFLQSGKEWYGEEFGSGAGRVNTRTFDIPVQNIIPNTSMSIRTDVLGRTIGRTSQFDVRINSSLVYQMVIPSLTGAAYEPVGTPVHRSAEIMATSGMQQLTLAFNAGNASAQGWLDKFEWNGRVKLDMRHPKQLSFRDTKSRNEQAIRFSIDNAPLGVKVWEVTDFIHPIDYTVLRSGNTVQFNAEGKMLREFVAFNSERSLTPVAGSRLVNQNLHGADIPQYLIVTTNQFRSEANRLGAFHFKRQGLRYLIADVQQIYNEFSSGSPDPTAIRDFIKMFHDKAGVDSTKRVKFVLFFGDASYDYKNRITSNTNIVPAYQSSSSLDLLTTYTSDDYFGFLDDHEDINAFTSQNLLDVGIGRIPVSTTTEAKNVVDKIERYPASFGPWRTAISFVADDEDQNIHLLDAEHLVKTVEASNPLFHHQKIYLDAFPQESGAGGARYPKVNEEINRRMFNGNLIWNYSGHGGFRRLAEEAILEETMINQWQNDNRLPLFITATCDFAPFDNPQIQSLGEQLLLKSKQGAIALMTTTRAVFAFANRIINTNYLRIALSSQANGSYLSLGEAVRQSKNYTYQTVTDVINNRKFILLGDPALVLGFPQHSVVTTAINDMNVELFKDTLRALNQYTFSGEVRNQSGMVVNDFNGTLFISFFDKEQERTTRGNDPGSNKVNFTQQQNLLFKGKSAVKNGRFRFSFVVPRDIDLRKGAGRLQYYAENGSADAAGTDQRFYLGGLGNLLNNDQQGPVMKGYLNDEKFINGGIVNEKSVLLVSISDTSGLNITGAGIGHDMVAILDGNTNNVFVLNDFFEAEMGSFTRGTIRFPLPTLEEGLHQLKIRAWDVFNNPTEIILTFSVIRKAAFQLRNVRCYPNPFSQKTTFSFEHNYNKEDLRITWNVFTQTGEIMKTFTQIVRPDGNRTIWEWDGTNDSGIQIPSGSYYFSVIANSNDGQVKKASGKLIKY